MEENNEVKTEKKVNSIFEKFKKNTALILVFAVVLAYLGIEIRNVLNVKLETQTAVETVVYDTIDARALVVRNESAIPNRSGAVTVPYVANGEKVKVGGRVAMQFPNEESAHAYSDYINLEKKLNYYIDMEKSAVGQATDVQSLDKDILSDINGYIRSNSKNDAEKANSYAENLNSKFTRRQILIGKEIDFSSIISSIESEMNALGGSSLKPAGYIQTPESGIFMQYSDGLENAFDYKNIENVDIETLNGYIATAEENENSANNAGKIIRDFDWYFCAVVSADALIGIQNGDKVDVALKNSDDVISCKIVNGAEITPGQKETALVIKCSEVNGELASLRVEDIKIRIAEHRGIKMPLEAVHIKDGEKGVYALVASVVEWRRADILYTGDNYVILSDNSETENGIKLYDEIIVRGKDLHDGKVYT